MLDKDDSVTIIGLNSDPHKTEKFKNILQTQSKYEKEEDMNNFKYLFLSRDEVQNIHEPYSDIVNFIKKSLQNSDAYKERISFMKINYENYRKYSSEKSFKNFDEYLKKFKEFYNSETITLCKDFTNFEKLSFNTKCITDEVIVILQILTMKKSKVCLELNKNKCDICKRRMFLISKIIISDCFHCYCHECFEKFLKNITENTMKLSAYQKNQVKAKCMVIGCDSLISFDCVKQSGRLFEDREIKEDLISKDNNCELCGASHSVGLNTTLCCGKKYCRKSFIDKLQAIDMVQEGAKRLENSKCPFCNKNIEWFVLEYIYGEEEYKRLFGVYY